MVTANPDLELPDLDPQYVERTAPQVILNKMTKSKFDSIEKDPDQLYAITDINASVERELTQAQYNALSDSEKNNGTTYYVTDGNPSGSVESYSTAEVPTGGTWIDGKPIYKKTISIGALPNNNAKLVAHGVQNIDNVVDQKGFAKFSTGVILPLPFASSATAYISLSTNATNITVTTTSDRTAGTAYVTIWYTKN